MTERRIDINLQIADSFLALKNISIAEEGIFREAAKGINDRVASLKSRFKGLSDYEALGRVTLLYAKAYLTLRRDISETEELLQALDSSIDKILIESSATEQGQKN